MSELAVIIPAHNEAANIVGVIRDIRGHCPEAGIIVVDDNSEDGTAAEAALPGVTVLGSPISLGIGGAVQVGIRHALLQGHKLFARMDGDGQHRAEALGELLRRVEPNALVQGSRPHAEFAATSSWLRKAGSLYFHLLFRLCTGRDVPDPTSGFMCFGRDVAEKFARFYPTDYPEIESLVLLARSRHKLVSVPVAMRPRREGESSIGLFRGIGYMISVTLAFLISFTRKNPYGAAHGH